MTTDVPTTLPSALVSATLVEFPACATPVNADVAKVALIKIIANFFIVNTPCLTTFFIADKGNKIIQSNHEEFTQPYGALVNVCMLYIKIIH